MFSKRLLTKPTITKGILQNLKQIEFDVIRPKLANFLTQFDHWKLPQQTEEFYSDKIATRLKNNDASCEYSLNNKFKLNDNELNITTKANCSLFAYLTFPQLADSDFRYCGVLKLYTEWLFIFDDYCESMDPSDLPGFLECIWTELFSLSDRSQLKSANDVPMYNKAIQFVEQIEYIIDKLEPLSNNPHVKEQFININKDYIMSLLFEKFLIYDYFSNGKKINKNEQKSIRTFSSDVYAYTFVVQLLDQNYQFTPISMFEQIGINTINDAINYYKHSRDKITDLRNLVVTRGYQNGQDDCCAEYQTVHSISYYNDLIGFRKEVKEEVYPFNSLFVYGSSIINQEKILNATQCIMNEFDNANKALDKFSNTFANNLKICCYGINLWQDIAHRYKQV